MNSFLKQARLPMMAAVVAMLFGCGAPMLKVGVSSTANLNTNDYDEALPVVVRIYQLSGSQAFEAASFEQLWKNDLLTLGESLVMKEELVMNPADQQRLTLARHDQARFIATVAVFRSPGEENWKSIEPLPTSALARRMSRTVKIALRGNEISLAD